MASTNIYDVVKLHSLKLRSFGEDEKKHVNYLLDAIPLLNAYHASCLKLQNAIENKMPAKKMHELALEKIDVVNKYIATHFPDRKQIPKPETCEKNLYLSQCHNAPLFQDNSGDLICSQCAVVCEKNAINMKDPSRNLSYNRSMVRQKSYSYKRLNHFREYLRQQTGLSKASVQPEILNALHTQLKKHRICNDEVTPKIVRKFLRLNKHSSAYEHSISIAKAINSNIKPVQLPVEYVEKLCLYFLNLDNHFDSIKAQVNKKRKNFLSYAYTFFKLNELLGHPEYNKDVKMLKSVELTLIQDQYWALLMKKLQWKNNGRTISV